MTWFVCIIASVRPKREFWHRIAIIWPELEPEQHLTNLAGFLSYYLLVIVSSLSCDLYRGVGVQASGVTSLNGT